jgi:hypothetical protein
MAMAAFERARELSDADPHALRGIGATASLASNRPKRGPHRIHVAWQSVDTTAVTSYIFPSECTRANEEKTATELILNAVAEACALDGILQSGDEIEQRKQLAPPEWTELLLGRRKSLAISPTGIRATARPILFPGAFNPIHAAHKRVAEVAAQRFGSPVTFEVSIMNVEKPPLDFIEIADRLAQFQSEQVLLTRAPTFVEKAELAPGCIFIVGIDTLVRIGDPIYYHGEADKRDAAIDAIAGSGCRFLVFGRLLNRKFMGMSDVELPPMLRALCDEVPESVFREDVSSTELRRT